MTDQDIENQGDLTLRTVPLTMYHEDRRIVIGEATVDLETLMKKGDIPIQDGGLTELVATVFKFGG